jgi:hypothetical protein
MSRWTIGDTKICRICKKEKSRDNFYLRQPSKPYISSACWHTDHDHSTGKFRGVLCRDCNWMLGKAKDSSSILRKGAEYLEAQVVVEII